MSAGALLLQVCCSKLADAVTPWMPDFQARLGGTCSQRLRGQLMAPHIQLCAGNLLLQAITEDEVWQVPVANYHGP